MRVTENGQKGACKHAKKREGASWLLAADLHAWTVRAPKTWFSLSKSRQSYTYRRNQIKDSPFFLLWGSSKIHLNNFVEPARMHKKSLLMTSTCGERGSEPAGLAAKVQREVTVAVPQSYRLWSFEEKRVVPEVLAYLLSSYVRRPLSTCNLAYTFTPL